jgi:hypothetical protein
VEDGVEAAGVAVGMVRWLKFAIITCGCGNWMVWGGSESVHDNYSVCILKPNSLPYNLFEVSRHNLESSQT